MKVYVFTYHQAVDCEFLGTVNRVFLKREDALKAFNEWREDEMKYVEENEWIIDSDREDHFEACANGRYCTNHTEGFINEYDVE